MKERRKQILTLLQSGRAVSIQELSQALGVSRETVRKDLYQLEEEGLLTKVRGGAVLTSQNVETAYDQRLGTERGGKEAIAAEAARLVSPGDTVYLDYGTTSFMVAVAIARIEGITVVTSALPIAQHLAGLETLTVQMPGGVIRGTENSLYGPLTARNLRHLHFDIGFFGCSGVDARIGFTNPNAFESEISALAIERSSTSVMVVDHTKFGTTAANVTAEPSAPDLLVTDDGAPAAVLRELEATGLRVRIAPSDPAE